MEHIAARIEKALKDSGLTARNLAAMANVHYTTVYNTIRYGDRRNPVPAVAEAIDKAIETINRLVELGELPMPSGLSQETRQQRLDQSIKKLQS